ncbi:MAG: DUF4177 domain-containing protein [Planctomycetes bacterium]|nr:DUF4177 domain-containing protein [Planctomycetota bacterium]
MPDPRGRRRSSDRLARTAPCRTVYDAPVKTTWEYTSLQIEAHGWLGGKLDASHFDARLNELGRDGWELVNVFDTNQAQGATRMVIAVFKRPR